MYYLVMLDDGKPLNNVKPRVMLFSENDVVSMNDFIASKTNVGYTCNVFRYMESFKSSTIVKSFIKE